jgi:hypothetical protein
VVEPLETKPAFRAGDVCLTADTLFYRAYQVSVYEFLLSFALYPEDQINWPGWDVVIIDAHVSDG